jgi:type VI secretion system protein ImpJ
MFLTPQHFQTQDNFVDDALQFRFTASNFANWGVTQADFDEESLGNGVFVLRSCRGILPDGTLFNIPDCDAPPARRPITEDFKPNQVSLDVYLALPERQPSGKNFEQSIEAQAGRATTRYVAEKFEITDENGYDEPQSVQLAAKNFRLLFGNQSLEGFVSIRIGRVVRNDKGLYAFDNSFIPPCVDIASSDHLMNLLRRQIEILVSKAESLNSRRRERGQDLADFNTSESASFWLLHTVNSYLPELQHVWNVRHGHPEALWTAMLRLAGALCTFSLDQKSWDFPHYHHNDLSDCFTALDGRIRTLLEKVLPSKYVSIPLRQTKPSVWVGAITDDQYFKNSSFFLALTAQIGDDEVTSRVPLRVAGRSDG